MKIQTKVPNFALTLFLDMWFRITLRFNFSNVNISASIYPP
jgi:hypothetical protein